MNDVNGKSPPRAMPAEQLTGIVEGQVAPLTDAPLLTSATTPWSGFLLEEIRADLAPNDVTWGWHRTHACVVTHGTMMFSLKIEGRQERIAVQERDVVIFPSGFGESHFVYEGSKFQVLVVGVAPERVSVSNQPFPHIALKPQIGISDQNLARILMNMKDEVTAGCPSGALYGQSLSIALVAYLEGRFAYSPRRSAVPGKFSPSQVKLLADYVRVNIGSDLNLSDLANLVGMSSRTFSRYFLKTFGVRPYQYVLTQRLNEAKSLLMSGKCIEEAAHAAGFSRAHFSSTFRKAFQITPREFQSKYRLLEWPNS